ncbi:MAG: AbrB family transcriptional regulator [Thermoleophilaceae bacterium]|jgi:hypothetical protein|nr:AbrB family transcriptional regulator [Thermoleophilaceae bacterium]
MAERIFLNLQGRGVLNLPAAVRRRHLLDEPGAQVELVEREGVIELHPQLPRPADQAWFWSARWQEMEREADEDVRAGRVARAEGVEEFLAELDE